MTELTFNAATHAYYLGGARIPSVTQVIGCLSDFSGIDEEVLWAARERGALVHLATAMYDRGELTLAEAEADPEIYDRLVAWVAFRGDTGFVPAAVEVQVYSNRHRYAGTIDRIGPFRGGVMSVLDIKTSASVNPIVALQLAAYQQAYNEGRKAAEKIRERWSVQLRADGTYRLDEYKDKADLSVFLSCLLLHNWKARNT